MSIEVSVRIELGTPVVSLSGMADESVLLRLVSGVEAVLEDAEGLVVVELDGLVLHAGAVRAFLARLLGGDGAGRLAFACHRTTGRRALRHLGPPGMRVVATAADAVAGSPAARRVA